jgi:hypothetical protein
MAYYTWPIIIWLVMITSAENRGGYYVRGSAGSPLLTQAPSAVAILRCATGPQQ